MTHSNNSEIMENHANKTCHGQWMSEEYEPGLVSVIIPTYNRAKYLIESMDSVLSQTYRPIELIVVDDGSTDGTRQAVQEWTKKLAGEGAFEVRYFYQTNKGAPAARNLGLIESHGEFIQFFDSDDLMHPDKLQLQVKALVANACEWSGCLKKEFSGTITDIVDETKAEQCHHLTPDRNICSGVLATPVGIYRRVFLRQVGFWREDLRIMQDTEYMFRVLLASMEGAWVEQPLCFCRHSPSSIMNQPIKQKSVNVLHSIRALEELAQQTGWYTDYLRDSFGRTMAYYFRQLLLHGFIEDAECFYSEAIKRLGLKRRWKHQMYRAFIKAGGLPIVKRFGLY